MILWLVRALVIALVWSCQIAVAARPVLAQAPAIRPEQAPFSESFKHIDRRLWYMSDGWRNGPHQNCTWSKRALGIDGGAGLSVRYFPVSAATPEPLCGELQSKKWFQYGTFEARIRPGDGGSGMNAAFFAFTGPVHKQPHDEIDFEILLKDQGLVWLNRYVDGKDFGEGQDYHFNTEGGSDFHDFAFQWEPGRLRWYVDGTLAREVTTHVPTHPMKVYFSLWGSDSFPAWMGPFKAPEQWVAMTVASFHYTPLGQGCTFEGSILCK